MRAVLLLRGVNVGGVRIAMKELKAALEQAGFCDVRTVLASGNVVLTASGPLHETVDRVVDVIEQTFGHRIAVIGTTVPAVASAAAGYPFARADDRHAYVVFAEAPAALRELVDSAGDLDPAEERVEHGDGVLYWDAPKGGTLDTRFGRHFGKRQRSGAVTTRNLNTLEKILAGE